MAALLVAGAGRHVPESRDPARPGRFDSLGGLGAVALAGVTYALIAAGDAPGAPAGPAPRPIGVARRASRSSSGSGGRAEPMLPPRIFADREFTGANLGTFAVYGGARWLWASSWSLQLQTVLGYNATAAGAAHAPRSIVLTLLLRPRAGALAPADRARLPMTVGPLRRRGRRAAAGPGRRGSCTGSTYCPGSLLQGLGLALPVAPLTATVLDAAPDHLAGVASGVNNAVARAAQLLAVAALPGRRGPLRGRLRRPGGFTAGYRMAMLVCAALFAARWRGLLGDHPERRAALLTRWPWDRRGHIPIDLVDIPAVATTAVLLVGRIHVDLLRVSTAACPGC